ncbi:hypothetical protein P22_2415 [Propionispora sp. 2/2-37]|uniref:hypothetical protein n=1 Tax=Propionispora sp. 2/2-37 TaxID=1677858 RepID=UPI0006BB6080|nr:hypothetical protein [Propionispora sp. 2/2-37]CUH96325.1 hypothetical protein P22_2415 [Propionispora sp. 2/2-37]
MNIISSKIFEKKVIIKVKDRVCDTPEELLSSDLFARVVKMAIRDLTKRNSILLDIFTNKNDITDKDIRLLIDTLIYASKMPIDLVVNVVKGSEQFAKNPMLLNDFIQYLYNFWRNFDRFVICNSDDDELDKRPYRTFNTTVDQLTNLVRKIYRDLQDNVAKKHPNVFRQVKAGAQLAAIGKCKDIPYSGDIYKKLDKVPVIRQILLNPPLVLDPPMNKRTGKFERVYKNPLDLVDINTDEWLCFPAKVGPLLINIYFHEKFYDLGFSLCNLFEIANDVDLEKKPDAIYLFGVPGDVLDELAPLPTVFFDDEENDMFVAAVPNRDQFGYFGYLKKMALTLHNIRMMRAGKMPFHGAMFRIVLKGNKEANVLVMGDSGAGKSETLEAFRVLGQEFIQDIIVIADDMGSLSIDDHGDIIAYGTEVGAYVRLDDLNPGYAFGQLDRAIIMNPSQKNARTILPVTSYDNVIKGHKIDFVLYCNNFEEIDEDHPVIERFTSPEEAIKVFRSGAVMSKGTTTSTGLVHTYFANVFGPPQYRETHEVIAQKYFAQFFKKDVFVGQMRTRLSIKGWEQKGPQESAKGLLAMIQTMPSKE